ncbi:MAG: permease [Alphaproteobacteria bacterium]
MTDLALTMQGAVRRIDRVWLAIAAVFLILLAFQPAQALASASFALDAFTWILPFLLASVLLAAWLKAAGADRVIGATVSRSPVRAVLVFAAAGAFSPFCSCGVVPLIAALLAAGVPLPAVMAFWVASPLMDPEMFVLMWAMLGLEFTLAKTLAAFGLGLAAGFATLAAQRAGFFATPLRAVLTGGGCGSSCGTGAQAPMELRWAFWKDEARRAAFTTEARDIGFFLAKWLLFAFTIESLMVRWLPPETIVSYLGGENVYAIPLAVAIGVPAADGRADVHGHGAGRRARLLGRRRRHQPARGDGGLRPGAGAVVHLVPAGLAARLARHRLRLSRLDDNLELLRSGRDFENFLEGGA